MWIELRQCFTTQLRGTVYSTAYPSEFVNKEGKVLKYVNDAQSWLQQQAQITHGMSHFHTPNCLLPAKSHGAESEC